MQSDENESLAKKLCSVQKPPICNFQLFQGLYYDLHCHYIIKDTLQLSLNYFDFPGEHYRICYSS